MPHRAHAILNSIPALISRFGRDRRFEYVNLAAATHFGLPVEQVVGRTLVELGADPSMVERLWLTLDTVFADALPVEFEHPATVGDSPRWYISRVMPEADDDGVIRSALAITTDITDLKNTQEALRKSDERFRAIFDSTFQYIGLLSPDGAILEANRTALSSAGVTLGDVRGQRFWEAVWWAHNPALQAELKHGIERAAGGEFVRFEATHPLADGTVATIDFSLTPIRDEGGAVVLLVPEGRDVTARKRAEDALRASEQRLRAAMAGSLDAVFFLTAERDAEGRITDFVFTDLNDRGAALVSRSVEQVVGRRLCDLLPVNRTDGFFDKYVGVVESGRPLEEEFPIASAGITASWLRHQVVKVGDGVVITSSDVTDRKRAELALRVSEGRLQAFMRHAPAVMWIKDPAGRVVAVSHMMGELFGGADRWLGKTDHEVLPKEVADVVAEHDRHVRETGRPIEIVEEVPIADGTVRPWLVVKFPIPKPDGTVSTGGVALDLSERRKAEEDRRLAEQRLYESLKLESLGVLAGGIAHDFNNLLTSMLGYASLANMELASGRGAALPNYLTQIETAAGRAADLCKQMLAYAGKGQFQVKPVSLNKLVEEMAQLLQASISKKAVLRLLTATDEPTVTCDTTQIRQVVLNLITNASDAVGDRSGVISVATGVIDADDKYLADLGAAHLPAGRYAYLEVSDTGCGMSADTVARMFEPFYTTKPMGRGLGLSAIQGIVRGHCGAIKVYSELGRGTTFKILLPTSEQQPPRDPADREKTAASGRGRTVLVVDDEEDIRVFIRKVLERYGFAVALSPDGREGEAEYRARQDEIDLVLCDLTMPHQDGGTTFRRLRQFDPTVRVVLMSGFSADDATAGLNGMGLQGFLRKPFRAEELIDAIFTAVGP